MYKNLIKFSGIYNDPARGEENNIYCNILINFSNFNNIIINIKECEIKNNVTIFNEDTCVLNNDEIILNTLKNIKKIFEENEFEGEKPVYLNYLAHFIFKYIYCELYCEGNLDFDIVKMV